MSLIRKLTLLLLAAATNGAVIQSRSSFLAADKGGMRPEVVARTLTKVEEEWRSQAALFVGCNTSALNGKVGCDEAPSSFAKSCSTVVAAVVQGSNGNRDNAKDYLNRVCGQGVLAGWQKLRCGELATAIVDHGMNADDYANRESLNTVTICSNFWAKFVDAEKTRETNEAIEHAKEDAKKAKEAEEAKKKAEEKAKAEAKKRAEEKAKREKREQEQRAAEAKALAAEAKVKAAEAAARLAQKKMEALKIQQEAEKKAGEAAAAEKEHEEAIAKNKAAQDLLKNTTEASKLAANITAPKASKAAVAEAAKPAAVPQVPKIAPKEEIVSKTSKPTAADKSKTSNVTKAEVAAAPQPVKKAPEVSAANKTK